MLTSAGYGDNYRYSPDRQGPNKSDRIQTAFAAARRRPANGRKLLDGLLAELRLSGDLSTDANSQSEAEKTLRRTLPRYGWFLNDEGMLMASAGIDVETHGRVALAENVERLRRSTADPALLIGTAKDLLESVAKFVLEEHEMLPKTADFNHLWHLARERLGILPTQVDPNLPGYKSIKKIHGSTWVIAEQVNELRNLQGTGHGRTMPAGVSESLAMLVIREACSVAEYMLDLLEKTHGR